jgi:hypothetical protein
MLFSDSRTVARSSFFQHFIKKVFYSIRLEGIFARLHPAQGGDSQNFLQKFERFFVTLGLKILRLFRLKVPFEADIIKG